MKTDVRVNSSCVRCKNNNKKKTTRCKPCKQTLVIASEYFTVCDYPRDMVTVLSSSAVLDTVANLSKHNYHSNTLALHLSNVSFLIWMVRFPLAGKLHVTS